MSIVRTLLDRCNNIITEEEDRQKEELHIRAALSACGYPEWSMKLAKEQLHSTANKKAKKSKEHKFSTQIVIPYVKGLSESLSRTFSRYGVGTTVRPFRTVRNELVHPKNILNYEEASQCIYEIPCKNCDKVYVGETGRNLGTRLNEHRKEVETKDTQRYTSCLLYTSDAADE